jgi:hypothetical protein
MSSDHAKQRRNPEDLLAPGCGVALISRPRRGRCRRAPEICSSYSRACPGCPERRAGRKTGGQVHERIRYYHRIVAVAVVSGEVPVRLGLRVQQPGERAAACARLLLQDLVQSLGKRHFSTGAVVRRRTFCHS